MCGSERTDEQIKLSSKIKSSSLWSIVCDVRPNGFADDVCTKAFRTDFHLSPFLCPEQCVASPATAEVQKHGMRMCVAHAKLRDSHNL